MEFISGVPMLQLVNEPEIVTKDEKPYIGIRFKAPYSNMFSVVDIKFQQLKDWKKVHKIIAEGPLFLRYHFINMSGEMELEVGLFGTCSVPLNSLIEINKMPGGIYATQIYKGLGLAANKHLLNWIEQNNHIIDKKSQNNGDLFACRYEAYLTDPKKEPRKKQWDIELSIKLIY
jgi:effector-binding domain-containing protein